MEMIRRMDNNRTVIFVESVMKLVGNEEVEFESSVVFSNVVDNIDDKMVMFDLSVI